MGKRKNHWTKNKQTSGLKKNQWAEKQTSGLKKEPMGRKTNQ
jgi:hypothetical protein